MDYKDRIRGCLFGGACGDALGYPVEFLDEEEIFSRYGRAGITSYEADKGSGLSLISDDTQMTLFTASGLIRGKGSVSAVADAYQEWLWTQEQEYGDIRKPGSPLLELRELYSRRAPGTTCLSSLHRLHDSPTPKEGYIAAALNDSKGCGGVMRVAPVALYDRDAEAEKSDLLAAEVAAITHGHPLGYMTASVLVHILRCIVYPSKVMTLEEIVSEAADAAERLFKVTRYSDELVRIIRLAIALSGNTASDLDNIHALGEGWVAEEALAISVYCALRHQDDFSAGIIAAVNHKGDSDSTGAIAGNILGALLGYSAIEEKWKRTLELGDVILEIADELEQFSISADC